MLNGKLCRYHYQYGMGKPARLNPCATPLSCHRVARARPADSRSGESLLPVPIPSHAPAPGSASLHMVPRGT